MRLLRTLFAVATVAAVGSLTVPAPVCAQSDTGTIDGRVFDESRAPVPGATVKARNKATGLTRTVVVSAAGTYRISALPAGRYEVTAELTGFANQVHPDVPVQIGSAATLDFTMKVASVAETITVTGEAPLIQTTTSDVGQVITQRMVENIPLNGRKFQDLSLLVPGTRQANYYDPTKTEVGGISYGAGSGRSVIINVDGGDNNDGVVRGILQQYSNDAIQEYKVTTQRYSAEFGRSVGGVVNVVTKSGTNEFHGSAFVFARNERLNARTFFEEQAGTPKPDFSQQQFGGSLGGPIVKDKAHFFVVYERNRRDDSVNVFTNGLLPDEEGPVKKPFRNHLLTAKLNFQLGDKNTMIARYALEDNSRLHDFVGGKGLETQSATNLNKIHSGILKNTTVLGSSNVNELTVLFQHFRNDITADFPEIPAIQTPDFIAGANINTPQVTIQKRFQVRDDYSFRKTGWGGDHDFKVGAEVLRSHYGGFFIPTLYGYFNFASALPGPQSLARYQNAIADTWTSTAGTNVADDNWTYLAGYIQDDWKPTPRLTLNLGLRYEIEWGPYSNPFNPVGKAALEAAGFPGKNKNDYNNFGPRVGFAYDVNGDAKFVIRGGYGKYYDEIFQNITLYEKWSDPASPLNFVSASPAPFTPNQFAANRVAIQNSFIDPTFAGQLTRVTAPDLVQPSSQHFNVGFSVAPAKHVAFDVDYVHSTGKDEIHRWQVNTSANQNTRISPAGVFAPQLGPIRFEGNRGHSKFDGVYVAGKYRSARVQVLGTYAWSKGKNIADDFNSQPGGSTVNACSPCSADLSNLNNFEGDFGPTPNDVRHRGTLGAVFELPAGFVLSTGLQANTGRPYTASAGFVGSRGGLRAIDPATGQPFPRNSFTGPRFFTWDGRISKIFRFGKTRSIEVLFECFNITNHVNLNGDSAQGFGNVYGSESFGVATQIIQNSQRQAQVGVRLQF